MLHRQQAGWTNFPWFVLRFNATLAQNVHSKFAANGGVKCNPMNKVPIIINYLVLLLAILWLWKEPGYSPLIAALLALSALAGQDYNQGKIVAAKEKSLELEKALDNSKVNFTKILVKEGFVQGREDVNLKNILGLYKDLTIMNMLRDKYSGIYFEFKKIKELADDLGKNI